MGRLGIPSLSYVRCAIVINSDMALRKWKAGQSRPTKLGCFYKLYHILLVGIFRGRKLSWILLLRATHKILDVPHPPIELVQHSLMFSLQNTHFLPIQESFLSWKLYLLYDSTYSAIIKLTYSVSLQSKDCMSWQQ